MAGRMTTNSEVRAYAERIAALEAQKDEFVSEISDIKLEARGKGYDALLIGKIAKLINLENEKRAKKIEQIDLFSDYISEAGLR